MNHLAVIMCHFLFDSPEDFRAAFLPTPQPSKGIFPITRTSNR